MRSVLYCTCVLLLAAPGVAQVAAPAPSLLLRVDLLPDNFTGCERQRAEYLVFRDGLVIVRDQGPGFLYISRLQASREAMTALSEALTENQIGFASGECDTGDFVPNGGFLHRIDWFGKNHRHSTFTTGDTSKPFPPCSDELFALDRAVRGFIGRAGADPEATTATLPHPAEPPCP